MPKSTPTAVTLKPYDGFPLTAHRGANQWCKKFRGDTYYFGALADWKAAKDKYDHDWPYIIKGLTPPVRSADEDACTLRTLCNLFLESKRNKVDAGELTENSYRDYYATCKKLIDHFGVTRRVDDLRPVDFEAFRAKLAGRFSVQTLLNVVNRCRVVFNYAWQQQLIPKPVHYGQSFNRPSKQVRRKARYAAGVLKFSADEIRSILDALDGKPVVVKGQDEPVKLKADPQLKAMTLLGINGGLGVTDCGCLCESHIDFTIGWMDYPRVKTGIPRRFPLWTETIEAIKEVLASRKAPRDPADEGIVFLTRTRRRWVRIKYGSKPEEHASINAVSEAFGKVLKTLHINGRKRLNFYTLRRQFEIVAGDSRDQVAVNAIMGHVDDSMAAVYRQNQIGDDRLRDVVMHVHDWLFGEQNQHG